MEVDGKVMAQSNAMLRYAGKLSGLYPEDPIEAAYVDEVIDTITDSMTGLFKYRGSDKDQMREAREKVVAEDLPRYIGGCEKRMETFGDGPFAVGGKLSIADLAIVSVVTTYKTGILDYIEKTVLDGYPRFMASYKATMEHPAVAEWYAKHPIPGLTTEDA